MIKVIASDMDGTLLGDDHKIAPETLSAVKEACDAGIRFMICTGRGRSDLRLYCGERRGGPGSSAEGGEDHIHQHGTLRGDLRGGS